MSKREGGNIMSRMKIRMKIVLEALTFLSILVPCLFSMAADQKSEDKSSVEIFLSTGQKKTLTAPLRLTGRFEASDFSFESLSLDSIVSLVLVENDRGKNNFLLTLLGNEGPLSVRINEKAEIFGAGEWGKETIALSKIRSLKVSTPKAQSFLKPETRWRCSLSTGKEIIIGWNSKWSSDISLAGQIGNSSLQLDPDRLTELSIDGNTWTLVSIDRSRLQGWQPKQESLVASSLYGEIKVPWANVSKLSSQRGSASVSKPVAAKPTASDWLVEIAGRFLLPITDINTGSNVRINDDLNVDTLNWAFVDNGIPKPNGIELHLANKKACMLNGSISGISPFGKLDVDCKDITKLERVTSAAKNRISSDYDKRIVGTITTSTGIEYPAGEPSLAGGDKVENDKDFFGYGMFRVQTPPVEMWLKSESLLSDRLSTVDGKLVSHDPKMERYGSFSGFTAINFTNPAGSFTLPIERLSEYSPQVSPSQSGSMKTQSVKYRISVRDKAGKEFTDEASKIEFARYPDRGWSGYYSKSNYPFQWNLDGTLYFVKESDDRIDVEFDKIKTIEISDYSDSSRNATLTSIQGTQIKGTIYPGDVSKSNSGISKWDSQKEGLLCKLINGSYVYVPFRKGMIIEIQHGPQK